MMKIELNKIYSLMTCRYGVKSFSVDTDIELKYLALPKNITLTFFIDKNIAIDYMKLQKRLEKCISSNSFYVLVDEDKIVVSVECYTRRKDIDYDFEFSRN